MAIRDRITQFVTYLVKQIKCSQGGILIGRVTGEGKAQEITVGSGLTLSGTTLSVTGGTFAAASHTHSFGSITGKPSSYPPTIGSTSDTAVAGNDSRLADVSAATSDASDVGTPGKLLKSTEGGTITIQGLTVKQSSYQISIAADSISGTDGVSNWVIQTAGGGTYTTPTGSGTLALTPNADGSVSYRDLVDVPTTVPLTSSKVVANAAARLHLTTEQAEGFAVVDADTGKTWMLVAGGTPATSSDWLQLGDRDITAADITDPENILSEAFPDATAGQVPTYNGSAWETGYANPLGYISQTDYGIVAGDSSDVTATANAAALATAFAAASSTGKTLLLNGQIYAKGEVLVSGVAIKVLGNNAEIIQKDTSQNGLTLASDSGSPPYGLIITGVAITGQGPATHAASGIYGKKGDLTYLTSDITLRNCKITGFRNGTNLAGIAKFFTENLTISNVRIGHEWNHMQTVLCLNSRIVSGDSDSSSACFKFTGGNFFSNRIIMGEFGGTGFARFLTMTEGAFYGEALNLEGFTANQTINITGATGTRKLELKNVRVAIAYSASTQAVVSCEVNGNTGSPVLNLTNVAGWSGSPRIVEIYGTITTGGAPVVEGGSPIYVQYAATQGGTVDHGVRVNPSIQQYQLSSSFPVSGSEPGQFIEHSSPSGTTGDLLGTNILLRRKNNRSGTNEWSSIVNDALYRSLAVTGRVASGNNVETDIHNANIPIGLLGNNGESVEIKAFGSCAATANNKQFKFYFGGSQYFDFGSLAINNESWIITVLIQRGSFAGGTGYMKLVGILEYGSGKVIKTAETPSAAIDSSAAIATRLTVLTPSAASDAVSLAAKMTWTRTPQGF